MISDLKKLSKFLIENNYLKYSLDNIQKEVVSIGRNRGILNPKFPINFNSIEGSAFLGDLLTDGFLNNDLDIGFSSKTDLMQLVINLKMIHKLVTGVELQSSKTDPLSILKELSRISLIKYGVFDVDEKGKFIRYSKCLGKIINILNIPIGQRVYTNPHIPRYLFSASKDIIAKFFERVFINEARILWREARELNLIFTTIINKAKKKIDNI